MTLANLSFPSATVVPQMRLISPGASMSKIILKWQLFVNCLLLYQYTTIMPNTMALLIISEIIKGFNGVGTGASISTGKKKPNATNTLHGHHWLIKYRFAIIYGHHAIRKNCTIYIVDSCIIKLSRKKYYILWSGKPI